MPVFSRLIPIAATSYAVQAVSGLIFVPQANEKYYDFCGSLGWAATTFVSLYYPTLKAKFWDGVTTAKFPPLSSFGTRQLLLNAAVGAWTVRLGSFLLWRALKYNGDSRFDQIKHNPKRFSFSWFAQGTWVFIVGLPVYLVNSVPVASISPMRTRDYVSLALFASSWILEMVADYQKTAWRRGRENKQHDEKFITSGLWSVSRHPNFLGEIGLWTGLWALSIPALTTPYVPRYTWVFAGLSPVFTYLITTKVSGVPPLEKLNEKKFGGDPKWEKYKRTVPVFWPWGSKTA